MDLYAREVASLQKGVLCAGKRLAMDSIDFTPGYSPAYYQANGKNPFPTATVTYIYLNPEFLDCQVGDDQCYHVRSLY